MTDPISDLLTRIRNNLAVKKPEVIIPFSKIKFEIAKILEKEKWVEKVEEQKANHGEIKIQLKYNERGEPAINVLKRISKPGLRVYVGKKELPRVLGGLGMSIISTSRGLMSEKEARKRGLGGEVICEIH